MASSFRRPRSIGRLLVALAVLMAIAVTRVDANFQTSDWSLAHATFYGTRPRPETHGGSLWIWQPLQHRLRDGNRGVELRCSTRGTGAAVATRYGARATACYAGSPSIVVTARTSARPTGPRPPTTRVVQPPRVHFDMSKPAFMQIADWNAGIVPVMYRRYARFHALRRAESDSSSRGTPTAAGLRAQRRRIGGRLQHRREGDSTDWISMTHNWGVVPGLRQPRRPSPLLPAHHLHLPRTLILYNVADAGWSVGLTYEGDSNFF
uniref:Expansin n=1 Tax=Ananas comosus var. bracteatus TaxID=296719 RepID=A0A6V7PJV5_ANACO|nr:unnamed protein product [Ananas comosus var. bracteatus]